MALAMARHSEQCDELETQYVFSTSGERLPRHRIVEARHNEIRLEFSRSMEDDQQTLCIRFCGKIVLRVEWTPEAVTRTSYRPGKWEAVLLRYDRAAGPLAKAC
jgi:hypothetical protein